MLGRDVLIFWNAAMSPESDFANVTDRAISRARTAIVVLSRRHLQSDWGRREVEMLLGRLPPKQIFLLRLESIPSDNVPDEIARLPSTDFSNLAYVGVGFAKSERYIEFQDSVRKLAKTVAIAIQRAEGETPPAPSAA
jgi:hypothetical protein